MPIIFDKPIAMSEQAEKSKYICKEKETTPIQLSTNDGIIPNEAPLNKLSDQGAIVPTITSFLNRPIVNIKKPMLKLSDFNLFKVSN